MLIMELLGLLFIAGVVTFFQVRSIIWISTIVLYLLLITIFGDTPWYLVTIYWLLFLAAVAITVISKIRLTILTKPLFAYFKRALPPISKTEREALEAGDTWWEAELFQGKPDWYKLHNYKSPELTVEEQAFINNQLETLCGMLNDWQIVYNHHDLPQSVWDYLKQEKFFGLIIEKKYGGLGFSALAHSTIVTKIASRSLSTAINAMVPNSLGPGELLHRYGTETQKNHYLPLLAQGKEIPCFALTSLEAGSDAGAMTDTGIVCKRIVDGKEIIGIRLNFNKRYITLAPVATLIGLAFKLYDPDALLGSKEELGITVALLAANTSGVTIGQRHFPMNLAFMNGPISGKDVFITFDAIIGGQERIGQGWRMLMECLSIGRSISLPALSTGSLALTYRTTGAYARLRQQFKIAIGKFEGIAQAMAKIAGANYTLIAARRLTCGAVDEGYKPSVASAILKYHSTELARKALDNALDIHGGRGVQNGPNNYLANTYFAIPVAITVEGANILTRNLIIFGQGAIRCHPYILEEMQAVQRGSILQFDELLLSHIAYAASNIVRAFSYGITGGHLIRSPMPGIMARYYRQLTRMSTALAMVSDLAMLVLGGNLKRKEALSARLGDVLSALYLSSAILKHYADGNMPEDEIEHVCWSIEQQLANIQIAFDEFFDNFPNQIVATLLKFIVFPFGRCYRGPSDKLSEQLAELMMEPGELRDHLSELCYIGNSDQPIAVLDRAVAMQIELQPLQQKLQQAIKSGVIIASYDLEVKLNQAITAKVLTMQEAQQLRNFEALRIQALTVDEFPAEYFNKR